MKNMGMFHEASVPGVFAVRDCATPMKAVTQAVVMGSFGASALAFQLQLPGSRTATAAQA